MLRHCEVKILRRRCYARSLWPPHVIITICIPDMVVPEFVSPRTCRQIRERCSMHKFLRALLSDRAAKLQYCAQHHTMWIARQRAMIAPNEVFEQRREGVEPAKIDCMNMWVKEANVPEVD